MNVSARIRGLRFAQILHDDAYFLFQEAVAVLVVAHGGELVHQGGVAAHPPVQVLEGCGRLGVGAVQVGQVHLGIGLQLEFFHGLFIVSFLQIYKKIWNVPTGNAAEMPTFPDKVLFFSKRTVKYLINWKFDLYL